MVTTKDCGKEMIEIDRKQLGEALTNFLFYKPGSPSDRCQAHWKGVGWMFDTSSLYARVPTPVTNGTTITDQHVNMKNTTHIINDMAHF